MQLPIDFTNRMKEMLGEEYEAFIQSYMDNRAYGLRYNPLKINRETNKGLKRPDKYITCSSRKKNDRQLWIFEGDSAKAGFRGGRNPDIQAGYTMRGVPLNCYGMTPLQIMKNEVFNDIVTVLGLRWGKEFDINDLNFFGLTPHSFKYLINPSMSLIVYVLSISSETNSLSSFFSIASILNFIFLCFIFFTSNFIAFENLSDKKEKAKSSSILPPVIINTFIRIF